MMDLPDELRKIVLDKASEQLRKAVLEAAQPLAPIPDELMEKMASLYSDALKETPPDFPPTAKAKGKAYVNLLSAAAEFKRAAVTYAKATLIHSLTDEPKDKV